MGACKLAEIFIEAGVPAGVFNVVHGAREVGEWLTHSPDIEKSLLPAKWAQANG